MELTGTDPLSLLSFAEMVDTRLSRVRQSDGIAVNSFSILDLCFLGNLPTGSGNLL